ncbi:hypothetical protein NDU88_001464 [Pleurodeles waltl]|uniref:Uncharacterized protein n=1 Tax=Pleurodeles waltl TaxID=8319 RepID=A0AAV7MLS8_PLEWA|nr:hypothetical protein NDU88_001464 [Pleurodeles waltl]
MVPGGSRLGSAAECKTRTRCCRGDFEGGASRTSRRRTAFEIFVAGVCPGCIPAEGLRVPPLLLSSGRFAVFAV